jgi:acetylornithine deacetylase/succinyl-diaminopimelate desuccinylase-like protein
MDNGIDYTYGATVELNIIDIANGFSAPDLTEEMTKKVNDAAMKVFGNEPIYVGGGGGIPFMEVFGGMFPASSFMLTGAFSHSSNIHAANENLDLEYCRKLTTFIGEMISLLA